MSSSPVLELAAFTVHAAEACVPIRRRTHEALATLPGHRAGLRSRGTKLFAYVVA